MIELCMQVAVEVFDVVSQVDGYPNCEQKEKRIYE